jgi:Lrp/AsnC family transcriptional regulator for asnA, asnC and gidA
MKTFEADAVDRQIIDRLRQDNVTNTALSRELGLSEGAIRQRLMRLKSSGVLKVAAGIDPDVLAGQQLAVVALNVQQVALLEQKAEEVAALDHVLSVSIVSGRYDLIAEVLVDSNTGLVEFLTDELSKVAGLTHSESFLMLKNYGKYV